MTKRDEQFNRIKFTVYNGPKNDKFWDDSRWLIDELEKEIERAKKLTVLTDFLTKAEDGSKVIGFSRNGALRSINKAMHLARLAVDDKVRIEQMKNSVAEYDQESEK